MRGSGSIVDWVEIPRIEVILATGIAQEKCRWINLGYLDPSKIQLDDYRNKEDQGVLFVDHAGEVPYKLKS